MPKRNPDSPWNPALPARVTPEEYEQQVVAWLKTSGRKLENFRVEHLKHLSTEREDYEFDAVAEFTILNGARIVVLIECKRYSRPVERDHLLALWAKLQDVEAHKAMIFATCGFQRGALAYASSHGIATVIFTEGSFEYETRDAFEHQRKPPWAGIPRFVGIFVHAAGETINCTRFDYQVKPIREWLDSTAGDA